ncbi:MAG TPA: SpoIIE family protein phosphatase [Acidisarcina sp.]
MSGRGFLRRVERRVYGWVRREPPRTRLHRTAFWLLIVYLLLGPLRLVPTGAGTLFRVISFFVLSALLVCCVPLFWRWVVARALWKVRNRLVVTYLLMGLAPVLLLVTLGLIAAYVFAGEFASFAAVAEIDKELAHIAAENRGLAVHIAHTVAADPSLTRLNLPELDDADVERERAGMQVAAFADGRALTILNPQPDATPMPSANGRNDARPKGAPALQAPGWVKSGFRGMVFEGDWLYLRAVDARTIDGHTVVVVSSLPLRRDNLDEIAKGLGTVAIFPHVGLDDDDAQVVGPVGPDDASADGGQKEGVKIQIGGEPAGGSGVRINHQDPAELARRNITIRGGKLPPPQHFFDWKVQFFAPFQTRMWSTGQEHSAIINVESRPSLLYQRLVISSLKIAVVIEEMLIVIGLLFGLLELVAFLMGMRLNQTITRSIRDLYTATQQVDSGNFAHRIAVTRKDQLAALSLSFNEMTASLEGLLEEQREKERLQNELAIAQEVQANLFPQGDIRLPMLELHGVCRPARTVSGDYYDFLLFGSTSLGIALGDISGKGISAALLMATLHSAVRAYRFAGEELVTIGTQASDSTTLSKTHEDVEEIDCGELFESPARVLALLNRHLYRSTQPEKYATLFLAFYDGLTSKLTYSNGGQLPPILLRPDGSTARLDCGGTVVGLLEGMSYEQGTVILKSGDILVAYSDGVTEPENEFGDFGEERLLELVRRHQHLSLAGISEQVMQALRSWIGVEEQPDDITLVLARQL